MLRGYAGPDLETTRANVNGVVIAARSANDTGNNPHNPIYGINKAGASGGLLELIGYRALGLRRQLAGTADGHDRPLQAAHEGRPPLGCHEASSIRGEMVNMLGSTGAGEVMQAGEDISKDKIALMAEQLRPCPTS